MPRHTAFPDTLNWSLLHTFLMIAEERSISRAALRLNLTPSAVSHGLRRLEEQLEARLIERNHRNFRLTEQGMLLHAAALDIYKRINTVGGELRQGGPSIAGSLNLLLLNLLVSDEFDAFLVAFRKQFPLISVSVEVLPSSDILKKIEQNIPALGLALWYRGAKNTRRIRLIPQRYSLYCGKHHPLFTQEHITRDDLRSQNFVTFFSDQLGDSLAPLTVFRDKHKFTGPVVAAANSQEEVKRLLYAGYGIGCLADASARQEVNEGRLRRLPPEKGVADVPVYLVWHKYRKLSPAEQAFIDGICEAFQVSPDEETPPILADAPSFTEFAESL